MDAEAHSCLFKGENLNRKPWNPKVDNSIVSSLETNHKNQFLGWKLSLKNEKITGQRNRLLDLAEDRAPSCLVWLPGNPRCVH